MDFIFISMPYAKFDSKWFSNVPNINLGIMDALLTREGKKVKTFHFHLTFLEFLKGYDSRVRQNLAHLSKELGVEYLSLDYVFASLLFEDLYLQSRELFMERLTTLALTLEDFEELRETARSFIESAFSRISPHLSTTKLVGFSCSHYQLSGALLLCAMIKQAYPQVSTVVGGKDCAGAFSGELLSCAPFLDFVATGECEVTILSLLKHLDAEKEPLCNVLHRDESGRIAAAESKPNLSMETLPFPEYHFTDIPVERGDLILPIELGRGCPWGKCTFCPDESYGVRCQSKSIDHIKGEMDHYQNISRDLRNFIILDPDALKDRGLVIDLSKYLQGKGFMFHFAEFRAERMDREVLESLLRFGFWISHFQVGIESFSDRVLKLMDKGVSAMRNVEVMKMVAQLGVPLQFNLFTSYPNMTSEDVEDNLRVMERITHLLAHENILIFPGEFYLPADCPIFLNMEPFNLDRNVESIFSDVFVDFPMPSYSNYPYPYEFGNQEEQMAFSAKIREKVTEIKSKDPAEHFMCYRKQGEELQILVCRHGKRVTHTLAGVEEKVYLSAIETSRRAGTVSKELGISKTALQSVLDDFDRKGLILYSADGTSFFSLATKCN
jgi:hypothetical protein